MSGAWLRAVMSVCLCGPLFSWMLWKSLHPPEEDTRGLAVEVENTRKQVVEAEAATETQRRENVQLVRDVNALRTANNQHSTRLEKLRLTARTMEENNTLLATTLRAETKNLEAQAVAATRTKEQLLQTKNIQTELQATLLNSTGAIATIASIKGNLASGCLVHNPARPLVFTVLPQDTSADGLLVKLNVGQPDSSSTQEAVFEARPIHFDKETSLTVLTFSFTGRVVLKAFQTDVMVDAKVGEKAYMIGSQFFGGKVMENNIYEGTISATNRQIGNSKYLQVAMPGNFGMAGAPLFNANREMIGILKGSMEGLERTSIAIPAGDILRVYKSIK